MTFCVTAASGTGTGAAAVPAALDVPCNRIEELRLHDHTRGLLRWTFATLAVRVVGVAVWGVVVWVELSDNLPSRCFRQGNLLGVLIASHLGVLISLLRNAGERSAIAGKDADGLIQVVVVSPRVCRVVGPHDIHVRIGAGGENGLSQSGGVFKVPAALLQWGQDLVLELLVSLLFSEQ